MKFECIHDCVFRGVCVNKGAVIELAEGVNNPTFNASFKPVDAPSEAEKPEKHFDVFGKEKISKAALQRKLEELGVPFSARDSWEKLMERFEEATNNE